MTKVHIGCGTVFLSDYVNVDLRASNTYLAKDRPDLVERWRTTADAYYAKHQDKTLSTLRDGPLNQESVCDIYGSFTDLPYQDCAVDEVLARHCFEHLSSQEASKALDAMEYIIKVGGHLILDVPDHDETLRLYAETKDPFYLRHLQGPRREGRGQNHMMSYSKAGLIDLVEEHGFRFEEELTNIHLYPSICLKFIKPSLLPPRDWVQIPWDIPADWLVAEVGPGAYPFQRANVYIDRDANILSAIGNHRDGEWTILNADMQTGLQEIADKQFDYVLASHCMEHMVEPLKAAQTLSRIAKRGTMVVPSAVKESLFLGEERDHKWMILPAQDGTPIFVRNNNEFLDKFKDLEAQKIMCRFLRTGPNKDWEWRYMRRWFMKHESDLDIVVHWTDELKIRVVE